MPKNKFVVQMSTSRGFDRKFNNCQKVVDKIVRL